MKTNEFILILLISIRPQNSFQPASFLICKLLSLTVRKLALIIHVFTYQSILYTHQLVSELLTHTSVKNKFTNQSTVFVYRAFIFRLQICCQNTLSGSYLGYLFLLAPCTVFIYASVIQFDSICKRLFSTGGSSCILLDFNYTFIL